MSAVEWALATVIFGPALLMAVVFGILVASEVGWEVVVASLLIVGAVLSLGYEEVPNAQIREAPSTVQGMPASEGVHCGLAWK